MMQLRRTEFMGEKLSTNVQTQNGSTKCISRLTKLIINHIYYERELLPEEFFRKRMIEGVPVMEFIPDMDIPRILKLNKLIEDLVKSIEKKELKSVCVELASRDTDKLIECYNIKYSYRDETTAKNIPETYTANSIQTMLKNMRNIFKNRLNSPVHYRNLVFRLTADTSGKRIESNVFSHGKKRQLKFMNEDGKTDIEIGTVCTPYHRLILRVNADVKEIEDNTENDVIIVEDSQQSVEPEIIELDSDDEIVPTSGSSIQTNTENLENAENMDTESSRLYSTILEMSSLKMSCICGTEIRDNIFTIIQCKNCSSYQHAECYGIHKIANIPARHLCYDCSCLPIDNFWKVRSPITGKIISPENNTLTDPRLVEFTIGELKEIGRMRLILMYIYREKKSPRQFLTTNFNETDIEKIVEKLIKHDIMRLENRKLHLNGIRVNLFVKKHFRPKYSIKKYF